MKEKREFHCKAVCNGQKMHVRLFNSIWMIHQPASSFYEAQTGEFILEAEELLKIRESLTRDRSKQVYYVYDSICQLLNNLLEMQESQLEMSLNPLLLGNVLSAEEHVLGCMCNLFRSWAEKKETFFSINDPYQ
ncbi:hypothetical protein Gotur_034828 [Gossypium turneri]